MSWDEARDEEEREQLAAIREMLLQQEIREDLARQRRRPGVARSHCICGACDKTRTWTALNLPPCVANHDYRER